MMGGTAGLAVAAAAVRGLRAIAPAGLPRANAIHVDGQVLAFAFSVATLVGLAFGLLPAFDAAGTDPHRDMQDASHRTTGGHGRTRRVPSLREVALALVLLVGAGRCCAASLRILSVPPASTRRPC